MPRGRTHEHEPCLRSRSTCRGGWVAQVASIAFLTVLSVPSIDESYSTPLLAACLAVCAIALLVVRERYLRTEAEEIARATSVVPIIAGAQSPTVNAYPVNVCP